MNRVIRQVPLDQTRRYFGGATPRFVDDEVTALIEDAAAAAYARGHVDGRAQASAEADERNQVLSAAIAGSVDRTHQLFMEHAGSLTEAAIEIAEHILGYAPHDDGVAVAGRVSEAIAMLDDRNLVVAVHPDDWSHVSQAAAGLQSVTVDTVSTLHPGEALIRGEWAEVDLTRDAALDALRQAVS